MIQSLSPSVRLSLGLSVVVICLMISVPFWAPRAVVQDLFRVLGLLVLALNWNLLAGFAGLVFVGQQGFIGIGTHASLLDAGNFVRTLQERQGLQTGCPEEIAFEKGWITADALRAIAEILNKNAYGQYLLGLLKASA